MNKRRKRWKPNRERIVRPKKNIDQQQLKKMTTDKTSTYAGALDPRRGQRTQVAPGRRTKERLKAEAKAAKEKEQASQGQPGFGHTASHNRFSPSKASPARLAALEVTSIVRRRKAYAQPLIAAHIDDSSLSASDRGFATLLVLGVVSTVGTLDEVINRALASPDDLFDDVRDAIRISTYEIIFLKKAPHAALDQGVELARAVTPSAARLANAVLHRIFNLSKTFPFGDPSSDLDALARSYAFPPWLVRLLFKDMGSADARALMQASNDPAPLFIHVNALKACDAEVEEVFAKAGTSLVAPKVLGRTPAGCFYVSEPRTIATPAVRTLLNEGKILVSDASAQLIASEILPDTKPSSFCEIGAGRGTKSIMFQSFAQRKYNAQIHLTSLDSHAFKTEILAQRAQLFGIDSLEIVTGNALHLERVLPNRTFDTVFVDAPCSGLGTLRRHPEIRWRITPENIESFAADDYELLKAAAQAVSAAGQLVYSTCTVTHAENNGVVKRFLESEEGAAFRLAPLAGGPCIATRITPGSFDAHFAARFVRES